MDLSERPQMETKPTSPEQTRVLVGPDATPFAVDKALITRRSPFFRAACAKRWDMQGSARVINLPEDTPEVFTIYLRCLYRNTIACEGRSGSAACFGLAIEVYILADKLGDLTSANLAIDHIVHLSDERHGIPSYRWAEYIFDYTPERSPLQRLMVDFLVQEGSKSNFEGEYFDTITLTFAKAVIKEYYRLVREGWDKKVKVSFDRHASERPRCWYHQHNDDHPKCT